MATRKLAPEQDALQHFERYLALVNLDAYREKYNPIKLVECDLPKEIQPLDAIYDHYWEEDTTNYRSYDDFYSSLYLPTVQDEAERFRQKAFFSKETFYLGLPARIYRTWSAILTQVQGAYVAATIYGRDNVRMSASLDRQGTDIEIELPDFGTCAVQIKKKSHRKEARLSGDGKGADKPIVVSYAVPSSDVFKKDGEPRKPYLDWKRNWEGTLRRLDNGFIIFRRDAFERSVLLEGRE